MAKTLDTQEVAHLAELQAIAAQLVSLALVRFGSLRLAADAVGCNASTLLRQMRGTSCPSPLLLSRLAAAVGRRIVSTSAGGWVLA